MANIVTFGILAVIIVCAALFSVLTTRIMRAVTSLLFVLFAISGMYFLLGYTFLGAVQLSIYAGAITMIYVFAIQLVSKRALLGLRERLNARRVFAGGLAAIAGFIAIVGILLKNRFLYSAALTPDTELSMKTIGKALMGAGKYQYVLPFEFISLFLLACIIGGLMIARENKKKEK